MYPAGTGSCRVDLAPEDVAAIDVLAMGQGISRQRWLRLLVTAELERNGVTVRTRLDLPTTLPKVNGSERR